MKLKNLLKYLMDRNAKAKYYWRIIAVLSLVNVGISAYLLRLEYKYATATETFCDFSDKFSCSTVAASRFSEFLGQHVALWGLLAYVLMTIVALYFAQAKKIPKQLWAGWLAFIGVCVIFTLYLTYTEFFIIRSVCIFCIAQQIVILLMAVLHWPIIKSDNRI